MNFKSGLILAFLSIVLFSNCSKELVSDGETLITENALQINQDLGTEVVYYGDEASERSRKRYSFNTLNAALQCTGLDAALFDGVKTVYAPTDEAFAAMGLTSDNICSNFTPEALTGILLYHVAGYDVDPEIVGCVEMLNGDVAQAAKVGRNRSINGISSKMAWVQAGRGFKVRIYAIDNVLMPADVNIATAAEGTEMFSSLYAAVLAADPSIAAALTNENAIFTVFAPSNQAFANLLQTFGLNTLEDLVAAIGVDNLSTVLTYHVAAACAFSNDLEDGQEIFTLQGESVTIDLDNLQVIDKTGIPANLDINGLDILTSNGIIHTIDKVLLPQAIIDAL